MLTFDITCKFRYTLYYRHEQLECVEANDLQYSIQSKGHSSQTVWEQVKYMEQTSEQVAYHESTMSVEDV